MEHGPGRVRMGTRRGTLSFIELPVDTGRRGYMICVPINIGCCCREKERERAREREREREKERERDGESLKEGGGGTCAPCCSVGTAS